MLNLKFLISFLALMLVSYSANALEHTGTSVTTVVSVSSYNKYGAGDVIFRVANPIKQCSGYWINKGDPGFSANLSMLLAALQAKTPVIVHGLTAETERWKGSSSVFCKLYQITLRG
ncbi:hypothetical protein AB6E04_00945 [Vibrio amylolyticus]|uniref:hypothetical protein n=1 Tax=Vibrio amylolyticus TaxID=2847292 RepID=UPI00354DEFE4